MNTQNFKTIGIVCFVICAICIFVAIEQSSSNANAVNAFNTLSGGALELKAATPTASKYAIFFAILSGIGGAVCLTRAKAQK
jgi:hypothetical protein